MPKQPLLNTPQAAAFIGVTPRLLEQWRQKRKGPKYSKFAWNIVRYSVEDLEEFARANLVEPAQGS